MRLYTCSHCKNLLYFENSECLNCKHTVGFHSKLLSLVTLNYEKDEIYFDIQDKNSRFRFCKNAEYGACNWLIDPDQEDLYCKACSLNRLIPNLDNEMNMRRWRKIEIAKHRLIYSLLRLKLPVKGKIDEETEGIAFDFLEEISPEEKVVTGHENGTITINIEEADDALIARHRQDLRERYRTVLGHFRHEIGHYYWELLIKNSPFLDDFRNLFGDERADYAKALEWYYNNGAPADWSNFFISPYAASHAWEDWAESWAHYLHLMDTLETAFSFGIHINPDVLWDTKKIQANIQQDPYDMNNFSQIIRWWLPLTFAVNSLNRSMGYSDFYPFVISEPVIEKLKFIHEICLQSKVQDKIFYQN